MTGRVEKTRSFFAYREVPMEMRNRDSIEKINKSTQLLYDYKFYLDEKKRRKKEREKKIDFKKHGFRVKIRKRQGRRKK